MPVSMTVKRLSIGPPASCRRRWRRLPPAGRRHGAFGSPGSEFLDRRAENDLVDVDLAGLLGGVVLTETVFDWPGMGRLAVEAVFNQDIPMVMATTILGSALVVAASLLVDLARRWLDPRLTSL